MRSTLFSLVCSMNSVFGHHVKGSAIDLDKVQLQMHLIEEEFEEVHEAFVNLKVALQNKHLATDGDIKEAIEHLCEESADLLIVTNGMGCVLNTDMDLVAEKKMTSNFKKVMTKPEADRLVAKYQAKGLAVEAREHITGNWVVVSIQEQWLAHKHYPKGKILKRI